MRISEVFTMGGDWRYGGGYGGYAPDRPYGGPIKKPGGYFPDNGRWTYLAPNDYRWAGDGSGYGYSRSHGLDGIVA